MKYKKVLVSACLIGKPCRYDGKHQARAEMLSLHEQGLTIPVCPEEMGGLGTPRDPAERQLDKVISNKGQDVSAQYQAGAEAALAVAEDNEVSEAFLKSKSPMCGCGKIYDGSFSGKLTDGDGVFAELLKKNRVKITPVD